MKKIVSYIVMIIIVIFMLTSCNLVTMVTGDYSELANRNFNALITLWKIRINRQSKHCLWTAQ